MKKKICIASAALLIVLIVSSCQNLFSSKPHTGKADSCIPEGYGAIRVSFSTGPSRTVLPGAAMDEFEFDFYLLEDGQVQNQSTRVYPAETDISPQGGYVYFYIKPGVNLRLQVNAYLWITVDGVEERILAAEGTSSPFLIEDGVEADSVIIPLEFNYNDGTGKLELTFQMFEIYENETFELASFSLYNFDTEELYSYPANEGDLKKDNNFLLSISKGSGEPFTIFAELNMELPAGFYVMQVRLANVQDKFAFKTDVIHIGRNLTTAHAYTFDSNDFVESVFFVTSNKDDGSPGTLRFAIDNAGPGTIIKIVLDMGAEIILENQLWIEKGLVIEGNGVTITRPPIIFVDDVAVNTYRLMVIDNNAIVTIRRVHFKGGYANHHSGFPDHVKGGAVYLDNSSELILESCIFSENSATENATGAGQGGAIYVDNSILSVYGCTFYHNYSDSNGPAICNNPGYVELIGNVFYGNKFDSYSGVYYDGYTEAGNFDYNVVDVTSASGNLGWNDGDSNTTILPAATLPFSLKTFRLIYDSVNIWNSASFNRNILDSYAKADFYGNPINADEMVYPGAVQKEPLIGYYLDLSTNGNERGTIAIASHTPNEDSIYWGNIEIYPSPKDTDCEFIHWLQPLPGSDEMSDIINETDGNLIDTHLSFVMGSSDYKNLSGAQALRAIFSKTYHVTRVSDSNTEGTLRHAINNIQDDEEIVIDVDEISLNDTITITKNISIEGNSVTLTRKPLMYGNSLVNPYRLVSIKDHAQVSIKRVHFKGGYTWNNDGGAIYIDESRLSLESCIFSDNVADAESTGAGANGGAIYSGNNSELYLYGCTFFRNTSTKGEGGAIYGGDSCEISLWGNIFYGNVEKNDAISVLRMDEEASVIGSVIDCIGNVSDDDGDNLPPIGFEGDYLTTLPFSLKTFRLISNNEVSIDRVTLSNVEYYPAKDFYGNDIPAVGLGVTVSLYPGAVQKTPVSGFYLDLQVNDSDRGAVNVISKTGSVTPNDDNIYPPNSIVTIAATPANSNYEFAYWLEPNSDSTMEDEEEYIIHNNGVPEQSPYTFTMTYPQGPPYRIDGAFVIQAVFRRVFTIAPNEAALLFALDQAIDEWPPAIIRFNTTKVPETERIIALSDTIYINFNVIIEGNGVTLTCLDDPFQLMNLHGEGLMYVKISRVHFKGGLIYGNGGAITLEFINLTLQSCIFSDNYADVYGGAIYGINSELYVYGCTFYNNYASDDSGYGGAIAQEVNVTLVGNIFYKNVDSEGSISFFTDSGDNITGAYNLIDLDEDTFAWFFDENDGNISSLITPVQEETFKLYLNSAALNMLPSRAFVLADYPDYPDKDFYGSVIGNNASAGAVQEVLNFNSINSAEQLATIGTVYPLNGNYELTENIIYIDGDYVSAWTPIGSLSEPFQGTFNGNNSIITVSFGSISLLAVGNTDTQYAGLFGCIGNNGIVRNLSLSGFIDNIDISNGNNVYIGAIAGLNNGTIEQINCVAEIDLKAGTRGIEMPVNSIYVGGIAGVNNGLIKYCHKSDDLIFSTEEDNHSVRMGGLTGANESKGKIQYSYNTADVRIINNVSSSIAGGIAGENNGSINNCYSNGNIRVVSENYKPYGGGIVGKNNNGDINRCAAINDYIDTVYDDLSPLLEHVFFGRISGTPYNGSNNYANYEMQFINEDDYYIPGNYGYNPDRIGIGDNDIHGNDFYPFDLMYTWSSYGPVGPGWTLNEVGYGSEDSPWEWWPPSGFGLPKLWFIPAPR